MIAITSVAVVRGMAILAAAVLRHVRTDSGPEGQPEPGPGGTIAGGRVLGPAAPAPEESCAQEESP